MRKRYIVAALLLASMFIGVYASYWQQRTIPTSGVVASADLGIYWNMVCTQPINSIDWGLLYPGDNITCTVYIRNEGTVPYQIITLTENWSVTTSDLVFYSTNFPLYVEEVRQTDWALYAVPTISGIQSFSFDIKVSSATP